MDKIVYEYHPKYCSQCLNILPYRKRNYKFCSRSCSSSYNNKFKLKSQETRNKISKSVKLLGLIPKNKLYEYDSCKTIIDNRICINCYSFFKSSTNRKTCSNRCLYYVNKKNGVNAGRLSAAKQCKRSKDEIKLFDLCNNYFNDTKHNYVIQNGWDADIVLPELRVAILWNGIWHRKQMPHTNHSLSQVQNRDKIKLDLFKQNGWTTYVFEDNVWDPYSAFEFLKYMIGASSRI